LFEIARSAKTGALFAFALCLVLCSRIVHARIAVQGDPLWALDASRVVIVTPEGNDRFRVEEVLLNEDAVPAHPGDLLTLPGFKLFTMLEMEPDRIASLTPNTRILLYLRRDPAKLAAWVIAQHGYAFFWVEDPAQVATLRTEARQGLQIRAQWNAAKAVPDIKKRVDALWSFLDIYAGRFGGLAQPELQKTGSVGGEIVADRFEGLTPQVRSGFLVGLAQYHCERLHHVLLQHLARQQQEYEALRAGRPPRDPINIEDWDTLPEQVKDIWGELYYGLVGVAGFHDRADLPFIRACALWGIKYRFKQIGDAALSAFQAMPDKANVPVIAAIWREFSTHPYRGNDLSPFDVTRALGTQDFPETVPVLATFLSDKNRDLAAEAQSFLTKIVGQDLGPDPKAWQEWFQTQKANGKAANAISGRDEASGAFSLPSAPKL
jgi:HEAT repeat protein